MLDFRLGSKADIGTRPINVRFTPERGRALALSVGHVLAKRNGVSEVEERGTIVTRVQTANFL